MKRFGAKERLCEEFLYTPVYADMQAALVRPASGKRPKQLVRSKPERIYDLQSSMRLEKNGRLQKCFF